METMSLAHVVHVKGPSLMANDSEIHDWKCGLRYFKHRIEETERQEDAEFCACGTVLGAWAGNYRLVFEPEDDGGQ